MNLVNRDKSIVLLACVGTSPAVLTETVWALAHEKKSVVPDRVVVITTSRGKAQIKADLLSGANSVWAQMNKTLFKSSDRVKLGETDIRVIPDASNNEADDLRSAEDNMRAADFMLGVLREFTENPDTVVYASIAGGRKTMSALMLSCMSLLGREDDKVYHVLTTPEAMAFRPKFFFPIRGTFEYSESGKAKKVSGGKVKIELFEVPYVPIRGWFKEKFNKLPPGYPSLVSLLRSSGPRAVVYPEIELDFAGNGCARILPMRRDVKLSEIEFLLLCVMGSGVEQSAWASQMVSLKRKLSCCEVDISIWWKEAFQSSGKFKGLSDKDDMGDLSRCLSVMRKKFAAAGFADNESLFPMRKSRLTFPLQNFKYVNEKLLPAEIRGYLLPMAAGQTLV